jgi:hypothetical protein
MIVTVLLTAVLVTSLGVALSSMVSGTASAARHRRDARPLPVLLGTAAGAGVLLVGWLGAGGDLDSPVVAAALLVASAIAALVRVGPLGTRSARDETGGDDEPR